MYPIHIVSTTMGNQDTGRNTDQDWRKPSHLQICWHGLARSHHRRLCHSTIYIVTTGYGTVIENDLESQNTGIGEAIQCSQATLLLESLQTILQMSC